MQTKKGFNPRVEPPKPSTSKTQKPTLPGSKSSKFTSGELD